MLIVFYLYEFINKKNINIYIELLYTVNWNLLKSIYNK
jgi:hypothetical protein